MPTDNQIDFTESGIFTIAKDKSPSDVSLRSAEWAIITQIDGSKTIGEIALALAMTLEEAIDTFAGLVEKELITFISTENSDESYLPPAFFENLENQLTKIIGPVAPFILEDTLWTLDMKKEKFKAEKLAELIEAISDEIMDDSKKIDFQQVMLELMKELTVN